MALAGRWTSSVKIKVYKPTNKAYRRMPRINQLQI